MSPITMEKVLSIALRLAAPPALLACGTAAPSRPPTVASPQPQSDITGDSHHVEHTATTDVLDSQSCQEIVADAVDAKLGPVDSGEERPWYDPEHEGTVTDSAAVACCDALAKNVDALQEFREMQCCMVSADPGYFCTPWGPPMPTAMA